MPQSAEKTRLSGILPVYKEKGFTSFDVVAKLRGILKTKKIGHTGTLDPDAEGVLPICIGPATKLVEMLTDFPKEYVAEMLLGLTTDTQDISGKVLKTGKLEADEDKVRKAIFSFIGEYDQIPPMYSALKHNGKKLYELAREGKTVERMPRRILIYNIDIVGISLSQDQPKASIKVRCSKGTYIRTLINDIGEKLGCGACMTSLIRTEAAGFGLNDCIKLSEAESRVNTSGTQGMLISTENVFEKYPKVSVKYGYDKLLYNGNRLTGDCFEQEDISGDCLRVYNSKGDFIAVYQAQGEEYRVKYFFAI